MRAPTRHLFHRQGVHLLSLVVLLPSSWILRGPASGELLGWSAQGWLALALGLTVLHQVYVWLAWRLELGWQLVTRTLGTQRGFAAYKVLFLVLLVARPALLLLVSLADAGSLYAPQPLSWVVGGALLLPAAWGMSSVMRYFGVTRATGADHFDARYRSMPFERRGAFRYVPNAMYALVFLAFWGVAIMAGSQAGLALALFAHAYIWVHYWCTERPDMDLIYGDKLEALRAG